MAGPDGTCPSLRERRKRRTGQDQRPLSGLFEKRIQAVERDLAFPTRLSREVGEMICVARMFGHRMQGLLNGVLKNTIKHAAPGHVPADGGQTRPFNNVGMMQKGIGRSSTMSIILGW